MKQTAALDLTALTAEEAEAICPLVRRGIHKLGQLKARWVMTEEDEENLDREIALLESASRKLVQQAHMRPGQSSPFRGHPWRPVS